MIIQIGTEVDESRILWKHKESDEWKRADIDDLIKAYEGRPKGEWIYLKEDETLQPEMGWFGICKCSNCSEQESFPMGNTTKEIYGDDFCSSCGADMRGDTENEQKNS